MRLNYQQKSEASQEEPAEHRPHTPVSASIGLIGERRRKGWIVPGPRRSPPRPLFD